MSRKGKREANETFDRKVNDDPNGNKEFLERSEKSEKLREEYMCKY